MHVIYAKRYLQNIYPINKYMKALRYNNLELEQLQGDEFVWLNTYAEIAKTSERLREMLSNNDKVYLRYYCDNEFVNKHPELQYFK